MIDGLTGDLPAEVVERFRLVISELVTNAVRHAPDNGRPIRLVAHIERDVIRVDIVDGGQGFDPIDVELSSGQESGWGLYLVERLTDRWGVDRRGANAVWAEFDLEHGPPGHAGGSMLEGHGRLVA